MSAKNLVIAQGADRHFLKFPKHIQKRIISAYERVKENPNIGVKLEGKLPEYYKSRVGDYRIIYFFEEKQGLVIVVKIEHRQGVYK